MAKSMKMGDEEIERLDKLINHQGAVLHYLKTMRRKLIARLVNKARLAQMPPEHRDFFRPVHRYDLEWECTSAHNPIKNCAFADQTTQFTEDDDEFNGYEFMRGDACAFCRQPRERK